MVKLYCKALLEVTTLYNSIVSRCQVRRGLFSTGQVRTGQVRTGQGKKFCWTQIFFDQKLFLAKKFFQQNFFHPHCFHPQFVMTQKNLEIESSSKLFSDATRTKVQLRMEFDSGVGPT